MFDNEKLFSSCSVDDTEVAKVFYGDTLGLEVSASPMGLEIRVNGERRIFLYPKADHEPATFTVLNFQVESIDRAIDELTRFGVQFEKYDEGQIKTDERGILAYEDTKIAWFKDPAGNILSIIEGE